MGGGWNRRLLWTVGNPCRGGRQVQGGALRRGVGPQPGRVWVLSARPEKETSKHEWIWQAPVPRMAPVPVGSMMLASASLVGPNTIQIIYLAEEQKITEVQTMKFTAAGVEKTYVASKTNEGTGETVVFKSFHERVDEDGMPFPAAPFRFQYLPQWPLFRAPVLLG